MWYVANEGKKEGPFSREEMLLKLQSNEINADVLVWSAGMANWSNLKETVLKELLKEIPPPVPPCVPLSPQQSSKQPQVIASGSFPCPKCGAEQSLGSQCCTRCGVYFSKIKKQDLFIEKEKEEDNFEPQKDNLYGLKGWLFLPAIFSPFAYLFFIYAWVINENSDIRNVLVWKYVPVLNSLNLIFVIVCGLGGLYALILFYSKNRKYPFYWLIISATSILIEVIIILYVSIFVPEITDVAEMHIKLALNSILTYMVWCIYFVKSKRVYVTFFKKDYRHRSIHGLSSLWELANQETGPVNKFVPEHTIQM